MLDRHPMQNLAMRLFFDRFKDLFGVKARSTDFEQSLIEGTYQILWTQHAQKNDYDEWEKTIRATFSILDNGFLNSQQRVAEAFLKIVQQIVPALYQSYDLRKEIESVHKDNEDIRIKKYLAYYKTMYEGLLRIIMAPIVFAYSIANNITDNSFVPGSDGRINLNAIKKMGQWSRRPQHRLAIGINGHIRNAYSHERFRILDDGRVELWDTDPRGNIIWGPEIWMVDSLHDLCDKLWINALAVVCALAIFSINTSYLITARGWDAALPSAPPLRREDLQRVARHIADKFSFDLIEFERSKTNLKIRLSTRLQGIDQDEEIYIGGEQWSRRYKVRVEYVESKLIAELLDFLVKMKEYFDGIKEIFTSVQDPDGQHLGEVIIDVDHLAQIQGPSKKSIEEARKLFQIDTLGDSIMYRRLEGVPREE